MKKRLFILALDGTPYTLLRELMDTGVMPNLKKIEQSSEFKQMDSVQPPVSSSAWASFMTGMTPDQHGILGFVDRDPSTNEWYLPNADHLKGETIWQALSQKGKRIFVMNVPVTYPPKKINGISICGFLGSDITKGTWPPELGTLLKARGYRIDTNTELAKTDLNAFLNDLHQVFEKRLETMWDFLGQEPWDIFMTHIMETDRLHHFFWEYYEQDHSEFAPVFIDFYRKLDQQIGKIADELTADYVLMLLSDHGFCTLKYAVYLNRWLADNGFLFYSTNNPASINDIAPNSRAYSLYPGRIYLNIPGKSASGGIEYENLRNEIIFQLNGLTDPEGNKVIDRVLRREEIYPAVEKDEKDHLPDLLAISNRGYDLKGNLWFGTLFNKTIFNGMHTYDDAFVMAQGIKLPNERFAITDLYNPIINFFNASE